MRIYVTGTMAAAPFFSVPFHVAVEGGVGAGKSTLLELYNGSGANAIILPEPLDKWRHDAGENLLELKLANPYEAEFDFQILVNLCRLEEMQKAREDNSLIIAERSIYSSQYVFVQQAKLEGTLTSRETRLLDKMFNVCTTGFFKDIVTPDLIIYLRTSPRTCLKRMQTRAREEEGGISLRDLQTIHERNEEWLMGPPHKIPCPVFLMNGEIEDKEERLDQLRKIRLEIDKHRERKEEKVREWKKFRKEIKTTGSLSWKAPDYDIHQIGRNSPDWNDEDPPYNGEML
jgi:deoxyadenosine/deoxycytidine kinase